MLLLLHILFYYNNYCGMGVIMIIIMGVRVVAIFIIIGIFKLLLIWHITLSFFMFF